MPHWPNLRRCYQNEVYLKQDDAFNSGEISIPIGDATADKQLELGQELFYPCCSFYLQGNLIWPCPSPRQSFRRYRSSRLFSHTTDSKVLKTQLVTYSACVVHKHTHSHFCLSGSFFFWRRFDFEYHVWWKMFVAIGWERLSPDKT